jgi:flagellar motor switch protein FliM
MEYRETGGPFMEILSQEEIDQLLSAIDAGDRESVDLRPVPVSDCRKIKIYDFKRPDKFSKEQTWTMSILHETFARQATFCLTNRFKMPCHVHVVMVDQLTYEEFIRSVPTPVTLAILNVGSPLANKIIIEIGSAISFSFINKAFGGYKSDCKCQHELTRLEWVVMKDVISDLIKCVEEGWKPIASNLSVGVDRVDTVPQFANITSPRDMVILITFEAKIGDAEGMINICYPYNSLNGVMEKLTTDFWYGGKETPKNKYTLINRREVPVEIVAEIFRRDYSIQKILSWKKEELLFPFTYRTPNTCYLRFNKSRIFKCVMLEDYKWFSKKIKITGIVENSHEVEGKMKMDTINPVVAEALSGADMTISVELGRTAKTINEILKMGEGTIVELDRQAGEPVDIKANGVLIAKGEVVVIEESFGVRIVDIVNTLGSFKPLDKEEGV